MTAPDSARNGSAFEEVALDYCDAGGHFVAVGSTTLYARRSPYRICGACITDAQVRLEERERYCSTCFYLTSLHIGGRCPAELGPNGARARTGDA